MSQKTLFILLFMALLGIAGFFLAAFFISRVEERPLGEVLRDVSPFGDIAPDILGRDRGGLSGEEGGAREGVGELRVGEAAAAKLRKISAEPVSGAATFMRGGTEYVRYVLLETGHIYEYGATTTKTTRITNTTAPAIKEVLWSENGDSLLVRYLDKDDVIKTYLGNVLYPNEPARAGESSGGFFGEFLEDDIREVVASPSGDSFFYLSGNGGAATGIISDFQNKKKELVRGLPFSDWTVSWPKNDTLVLTTRPSARAEGFSYAYTPGDGAFKRIVGGIFGLTVLPSPSLAMALYSRAGGGGIETFLSDVKTGAMTRFSVSTLPEKCAWGKETIPMLYCGVPLSLPRGEYPDLWYRGELTFSDTLWRIDTERGTLEQLARPEIDAKEAVDVIHPFLSKKGDFLFFINKKDSSLWSLRI